MRKNTSPVPLPRARLDPAPASSPGETGTHGGRPKAQSLAIVIVTYNSHAEIGACLDALAAATTHYETRLHIIDNASPDGTGEWLTAAAARYAPQFQLLDLIRNPTNRGFTAAVNQGLMRCRGDYLLILNPDVIIPPGALPELLAQLEADPAVGVVAPQLRYPDGRIQPSCRRFPRKRDLLVEISGLAPLLRLFGYRDWKMSDFDHRSSRFVDQPQGAFLLARRVVLAQAGLLDEQFFMFFSDVDWCARVAAAGWRIRFCSEVYVWHHKGASVYQSRAPMLVSSHRSFAAWFAKGDRRRFDRLGTIIVTFLLLVVLQLRLLLSLLEPAAASHPRAASGTLSQQRPLAVAKPGPHS